MKVLKEVNRNTGKFKMPAWWFVISIKILAPLTLLGFFIWNIVSLINDGGIYGYDLTSNIFGGWLIFGLCLISGFIVKLIEKKISKGSVVDDEDTWED